jgi:hypothetical protein
MKKLLNILDRFEKIIEAYILPVLWLLSLGLALSILAITMFGWGISDIWASPAAQTKINEGLTYVVTVFMLISWMAIGGTFIALNAKKYKWLFYSVFMLSSFTMSMYIGYSIEIHNTGFGPAQVFGLSAYVTAILFTLATAIDSVIKGFALILTGISVLILNKYGFSVCWSFLKNLVGVKQK